MRMEEGKPNRITCDQGLCKDTEQSVYELVLSLESEVRANLVYRSFRRIGLEKCRI